MVADATVVHQAYPDLPATALAEGLAGRMQGATMGPR